jgi:zinc-finger of acetyl-transferase ESCO
VETVSTPGPPDFALQHRSVRWKPFTTLIPRHYARLWRGWHALDEETCLVCGLTYVRESEADRRLHRSHHRKVVQIYEPKPDPHPRIDCATAAVLRTISPCAGSRFGDGRQGWLHRRCEVPWAEGLTLGSSVH